MAAIKMDADSPAVMPSTASAVDGSYPGGFVYAREAAPTRALLEATLADLEGGPACCAFASGMAAANAIFQTLKPGDRVLIPSDVYHGVRVLATDVYRDWGLEVESCDFSDLQAAQEALSQTAALVWLETPSNPQLRITDLSEVIHLARIAGAATPADWRKRSIF